MKHDLVIEGFGFRLRPVCLDDAAFILQLRSEGERTRFVHPVSSQVEDQEDWIRRYLIREGDFYFIIENTHTDDAEGTISIYDVSVEEKCGEVGRWIVTPNSAAAFASVVLAWELAFEMLGLDMFYTRTLVINAKVIAFLNYFKLENCGVIPERVQLRGSEHEQVEYRMTRATWFKRKDKLREKVARLSNVFWKKRELKQCVPGE
jgi:RimJ/RimL family protein N-acetyltransferase